MCDLKYIQHVPSIRRDGCVSTDELLSIGHREHDNPLKKKQCRLPLTIHIVRTTFHLVNQDFKSAQLYVSIRVDISPQLCILHQCPTSSTQSHNDPSVSSIPQASSVDLSKQQMLRLHEHRAAQTYICSHLCWFRKKGEIIKYRTKRT